MINIVLYSNIMVKALLNSYLQLKCYIIETRGHRRPKSFNRIRLTMTCFIAILQVATMTPTKFQFNQTYGSGGDVIERNSRWQ